MSDPKVKILIARLNAGWADLVVEVGDKSVELNGLSYLSDSLKDLAGSGSSVLKGHPETAVRFEQEPGELQLALVGLASSPDDIAVRVNPFALNYQAQLSGLDPPIFEACCTRQAYAKAIQRAFAVWKNAQDDYRNRWTFPFPLAEFDNLEALLR